MSFTFLHNFLFFLELIIVLFPIPTPSRSNFLSICYQSKSELFARVQSILSTPSKASEILSIYLLEEISLEPSVLLVSELVPIGTQPSSGISIISWECCLFLFCAGSLLPGSRVLFFLAWFPPFGSIAFCSFLRKGVEKQKFCDFPCLKMCLFYLLPWWLFGWVWNSRLEILFLQNFEGIIPSSSCLQVLV